MTWRKKIEILLEDGKIEMWKYSDIFYWEGYVEGLRRFLESGPAGLREAIADAEEAIEFHRQLGKSERSSPMLHGHGKLEALGHMRKVLEESVDKPAPRGVPSAEGNRQMGWREKAERLLEEGLQERRRYSQFHYWRGYTNALSKILENGPSALDQALLDNKEAMESRAGVDIAEASDPSPYRRGEADALAEVQRLLQDDRAGGQADC